MFDKFQIIAAPMAGITDWPYRRILRKCNPDIPIMTEMISCHSITAKNAGRNGDTYFGENTGAQIFGADAKLMADAAKILEGAGASWIDINMGCPVPKVATRAGAGAFLMRDHALARSIMESVVGAVKIPVSIKTRLGWDETHLDSDNLLHIANEVGISFATVHGRTRAQGYSGKARWEDIKKLTIKNEQLTIIYNGDIKTQRDVDAVRKLGAGGAMIGRAMLGNPWLFRDFSPPGKTGGSGGFAAEGGGVIAIIQEHFELSLSYYGTKTAVPMFRKHLAWYASGRQGANQFRQYINKLADPTEIQKAIAEFFNIGN